MGDWPPITQPELLGRMALERTQFVAVMREFWSAAGPREFERSAFERALGYPWERPAGSFILRNQDVQLLSGIASSETRAATVESFARDRHPLLAFGGNAAPNWLAAKFAHFPDEADRSILVLTGALHDFDVGPAAAVSVFGYMPATLFASPGTAVRAAIVWATPAQVTQLTWSEIHYHLGRLDDARFVMDETDVVVDDLYAYVHRFGSFCIDGSPVALAVIPATGRTAPALTQEQLLDHVAPLVVGPQAGGEDLVRAAHEDMVAVTDRLSQTVWPTAVHLQSSWTPYPSKVI